MCGRAVLTSPPDELRELFALDELPELQPRFNIAPSQLLAVVRTPRRLELLRWGIARPRRPRQINARVETIRASVHRQWRCLVVVSGFHEWKRDD